MNDTTRSIIELALKNDDSIDRPTQTRILKLIADGGAAKTERKTDRIIRRNEVAARLSVSPRSIDLYATKGILKRVKLPGQSRANGFRESEIEELIEGRRN